MPGAAMGGAGKELEKFVMERKGSLGCWLSLGTRSAASCSFCGPGQLAEEHLPSARHIQHIVVSLCPSPWHRNPALINPAHPAVGVVWPCRAAGSAGPT